MIDRSSESTRETERHGESSYELRASRNPRADSKLEAIKAKRFGVLWLAVILLFAPALAEETITFRDITAQAGIHFTHNNGAFGQKWLPETMGPGCAFIDYDNDGWPDILLVNGTDWPGHTKDGATTLKSTTTIMMERSPT